jgi:acyl carrier protein phosphodiesterase
VNWLAHLYLSEPSAEFRLGNILPDLAPARELTGLVPEIQRGIACHHRIDAFTDRHPLVRQTVNLIAPPHRRYASIVVDLYFDHLLASAWSDFSATPLQTFVHESYDSFVPFYPILPEPTPEILRRMVAQDWLCSYVTIDGLELALKRVGARFKTPVDMVPAVAQLQTHEAQVRANFRIFLEELREHLRR